MASRINTRFLLILFIAVMSAGILIGGLWLLQVRGDASRSVRAGDVAMTNGDYELARKYFGRAVRKEPGRKDYLEKLERAIVSDTPQNLDKARELYQLYLNVLRHEATHDFSRAEAHLRSLRELHRAARLSGSAGFWAMLTNAADDMWNRVDPADPARMEARLYRGLGMMRRATLLTMTELQAAEQDLQVYVENNPDSDLGWASLAAGRIGIALKLDLEGQSTTASERFEEAEATIRQALQQVPDGPFVNRVKLDWLVLNRGRDASSVSDDELRQAMSRAVEAVARADDARLAEETAMTMRRLRDLNGPALAEDLLRQDLQRHPEDTKNRLLLAETLYFQEKFDEAEIAASALLDAPLLKASLMAQAQFEIRRLAAALRVDVSYRRWERATPAEKAEAAAAIAARRDELVALIGDQTEHPLVLKADGKLAMARNEIRLAAGKFEQYLVVSPNSDFEVLAYSALCQQRLGQLGLAHQRIQQAIDLQPRSAALLVQKARLEFGMGRRQDAAATADLARRIDPENPELIDFDRQLAFRSGGETAAPDDPLTQALVAAQEAFSSGDLDAARGLLLGQLEASPGDVRLLEALARIEFNAGDKEAARTYLERALEVQPNNSKIWAMLVSLDNDDPVFVIMEYLKLAAPEEGDRAVQAISNLGALAESQDRLASEYEALGNAEAARRAREVAARAREESDRQFAQAVNLVPDHPLLVEQRFSRAIDAEDWTQVEQIIDEARATDADQVGGLLFRARYAVARSDWTEAARLFEQVTGRLAFSGTAWKGLAFSYQQLGRTADALVAYEESYRRNPNDLGTIRRYVPLLVQTGQNTRALGVMRSVAQLVPNDRVVQNLWLGLEAESGNEPLALVRRRAIFQQNPDDLDNAIALATLLTETEPTQNLLLDERGQPAFSPVRWAQFSNSRREEILLEAREQWNQEADRIVDQLVQREGSETLPLVTLRASIMRGRGDAAAGEARIRTFIDGHSESERTAEMYLALGWYRKSVGDDGGAIEAMQAALPYQDPDTREADNALGTAYYEAGDVETAIEHMQRVVDATGSRDVGLRLVECYARLGQFEEAERRLQEQIDAGGRDYVSWMLAATLADSRASSLFDAGSSVEAERFIIERDEALRRAEELDPSRTETYVARARASMKDYGRTSRRTYLDQALLTLDRAGQVNPNDANVALARVDIHLALDDVRAAIGELSRALDAAPRNAAVRSRLVQLLANAGQSDRAIEMATEGARLAPGSPNWHEMLGLLYATTKRDADAAAASYRRAFEIQPRPSLLAGMVDAEMGRATPDYAFVRRQLEANETLMQTSPVLRTLYARALDGLGARAEALAAMQTAYEDDRRLAAERGTDPRNISNWYRVLDQLFSGGRASEAEQFLDGFVGERRDHHDDRWLSALWAGSGAEGASRAVELLGQAIASCPPDRADLRAAMHRELAMLHLRSDSYRPAADALKIVIDLVPEDAVSRNNYAYILAEYLDDPSGALPYAEEAVRLNPNSGQFLDTLGWILYKVGDDTRAQQMLSRSLDLSPAALTYVHLAHVQIRSKDLPGAERSLRRAAESNPDPQTLEEIQRLRDDIRTGAPSGQ